MDEKFISNILLQDYEIDSASIERIKEGVENENYLVRGQNAKYVFRIYNSSHSIRGPRSLDSIRLELDFLSKSISDGIVCSGVVKNRNKESITLHEINETTIFIVVFEYVDGVSPKRFDVESAQEFGLIVSKLFDVGISYQEKPPFLEENDIATRAFKVVEEYKKKMKGNLDKRILELEKNMSFKFELIQNNKLSKGLVHGDLKLENVLFDHKKEEYCLLDFDDYRYAYLLEEATMALMHNLHSDTENIIRSGYYRDFIGSISNSRLLEEFKYLPFFLQVRFLYDVCKYSLSGNGSLVDELWDDEFVQEHILI